jgi:hypothetical protein
MNSLICVSWEGVGTSKIRATKGQNIKSFLGQSERRNSKRSLQKITTLKDQNVKSDLPIEAGVTFDNSFFDN